MQFHHGKTSVRKLPGHLGISMLRKSWDVHVNIPVQHTVSNNNCSWGDVITCVSPVACFQHQRGRFESVYIFLSPKMTIFVLSIAGVTLTS